MRFNRQRTGIAWDVSPLDVDSYGAVSRPRTPTHPAAAGKNVPGAVFSRTPQPLLGGSRQPCRPLPPRTECSEGMPWALLVLGWVLHQMPPPRGEVLLGFPSGRHVVGRGRRPLVTSTRRETPMPARPFHRTRTPDHACGRQPVLGEARGWQETQQPAWPNSQSAIADKTRQRVTTGSLVADARALGRTPRERNHRSVLRLLRRA